MNKDILFHLQNSEICIKCCNCLDRIDDLQQQLIDVKDELKRLKREVRNNMSHVNIHAHDATDEQEKKLKGALHDVKEEVSIENKNID